MASEPQRKAVLMASGGLDSTVLAFWLMRKRIGFVPLFVDYGQHNRETELKTLKKVLPAQYSKHISVIRIPKIYEGSSSRLIKEPNLWRDHIEDADLHLPHRNLLLLAIGVAFAESRGINEIYAAFIETHRAPGTDCCDGFFKMLTELLSKTGDINLKLPFKRYSKVQVAKIGVTLKAPIEQTFSCLAAASVPCGACPNCVDRLNAIDSLA
jgi:7-cyano-7-deazaguanine synthase